MGAFYDEIKPQIDAANAAGFGFALPDVPYLKSSSSSTTDYESDVTTVKAVQTKLNAVAKAGLAVDGSMGPKTRAAVNTYEQVHGLPVTGLVDDKLLSSLGVARPAHVTAVNQASGAGVVKVSTVIAALRAAAKEKGYTLSDNLVSMMIGQLRGAEGAYPGVHSSLGGTNNYGAAQVGKSLMTSKTGQKGWGGFAHMDSDPDKGAYLGWYYVAPSPLAGAEHWFGDNWWGPALAKGNPQTPTDYAAILYEQGYYGGMTPHGSDGNNPSSESGQKNVAAYAAGISSGMATSNELGDPPDDPSIVTVDPKQFETLDKRKITEDLYNKAKGGGLGSAWSYLLPATWQDLVNSNGVVWFGPPPGTSKLYYYVGGGVAGTGLLALIISMFRRKKKAAVTA